MGTVLTDFLAEGLKTLPEKRSSVFGESWWGHVDRGQAVHGAAADPRSTRGVPGAGLRQSLLPPVLGPWVKARSVRLMGRLVWFGRRGRLDRLVLVLTMTGVGGCGRLLDLVIGQAQASGSPAAVVCSPRQQHPPKLPPLIAEAPAKHTPNQSNRMSCATVCPRPRDKKTSDLTVIADFRTAPQSEGCGALPTSHAPRSSPKGK